jgi:hypothetical protein
MAIFLKINCADQKKRIIIEILLTLNFKNYSFACNGRAVTCFSKSSESSVQKAEEVLRFLTKISILYSSSKLN